VVPWVLLAPVVAMASAWLLLDQRPNAAETSGGVLLILGVLVTLRPSDRAVAGPLGQSKDHPAGAEQGRGEGDPGADDHTVDPRDEVAELW
jgi:hypothetical protein